VSKSPYNTKSFAYPKQSASNVAGMHPYTPSLAQSPILSTSPDDEPMSSRVLQSLARARGNLREVLTAMSISLMYLRQVIFASMQRFVGVTMS